MYDNYYSSREQRVMSNPHYNAEGGNFYNADFYGAGGPPAAMPAPAFMHPISQPFSIQFQNTSTSTARTATIWDSANALNSGSNNNFGNNADLVITVVDGNFSYLQLLWVAATKPFWIAKIDIQGATTSTVVTNAVSYTWYNTFGQLTQDTKSPQTNKFQQQTQVVTVDYGFNVDSFTKVTQSVPASSTITYRFFPNAVVDPAVATKGQQPTMVFSNPHNQGVQYIENRGGYPQHPAYQLGSGQV